MRLISVFIFIIFNFLFSQQNSFEDGIIISNPTIQLKNGLFHTPDSLEKHGDFLILYYGNSKKKAFVPLSDVKYIKTKIPARHLLRGLIIGTVVGTAVMYITKSLYNQEKKFKINYELNTYQHIQDERHLSQKEKDTIIISGAIIGGLIELFHDYNWNTIYSDKTKSFSLKMLSSGNLYSFDLVSISYTF